jgi:hypothetical protein
MKVATVLLTVVARANMPAGPRPWEGRSGGGAAGVNGTAAARDQLSKGPKVGARIDGRRDRAPYSTPRPVSPTSAPRPAAQNKFNAFVCYGWSGMAARSPSAVGFVRRS